VEQTNKIEDKRRASPLLRLSSLGKDVSEPQIEPETVYFSLAPRPVSQEAAESLSEDSQFCDSTNPEHSQLESEDDWSENSNEPLLGSWLTESDKDSEVIVFSKKQLKKQRQKAKKSSENQMKKASNTEFLSELWAFTEEFCEERKKPLLVLGWIVTCLYMSVVFNKWFGTLFFQYSVVFAAVLMYIKPTPPKRKNTKVQNIETDVSITFEEDGNISKTREIDTSLDSLCPHNTLA